MYGTGTNVLYYYTVLKVTKTVRFTIYETYNITYRGQFEILYFVFCTAVHEHK